MTTPRDHDSILAAWLEEGPNELPDATLRAITVATRTTHQTRRALGVPWRSLNVNTFARPVLAIVAVAILTGGAVYILAPGGGVGAPATALSSPTPSPSTSPAPSAAAEAPIDTTEWVAFSSDRYGFDIAHPIDWSESRSTIDWTLENDQSSLYNGAQDTFVAPPIRPKFAGVSMSVPDGMSSEEWVTAYITPNIGSICYPLPEDWEPVTIDGRQGGIAYGGCGIFAEAVVFVDRRVYVFSLYDSNPSPTLLKAFLSTVRFQPERPAATTDASPTPT